MSDGGTSETATRKATAPPLAKPAASASRSPTPAAALGNAATARAGTPAAGAGSRIPAAALGNAASARAAGLPPGGGGFAGGGGSFGGGGASGSFGPAPGPAPGPLPPAPPSPPPPALREPVELKGRPTFRPPADLAKEIKEQAGIPVWVAVRFGSLATGELPVRWTGRSFETEETGPLFNGHHPVHIRHPAFPVTPGAQPVLGVKIRGNAPSGFLDWKTPAADAVDPKVFFARHPVHELFGWKGIEAAPPTDVRSELSHGRLDFYLPTSITSGPFTGTVGVRLRDERFSAEGGFDVAVKGLNERLPFKSDGTTRLFAGHRFSFFRSLGKSGRLAGEIVGTFADGHVDLRGTLRYARSSPSVSGTLTVMVTDFQVAKENVRDQLGSDAPPIEPADPKDRLAITGTGRLDFALNEWLTGNATVIVHPEGYVTAKGEIVPTAVIPIFRKRVKDQELLPKQEVSKAIPSLDALVADVAVTASVEVKGYASIGPGTLHDLRVAGLLSTHPGITNRFDFSGTMSFPALAGISAVARGDIRGRVVKLVKIASAGLSVKGNLELQMTAEAATVVGRRPAKRGGHEYFVKGDLTAQAELVLGLEIDFTASLIVWEKHVPVHNRTFHIGGASVTLGFSYIFGDAAGSGLTLSFKPGDFDPTKYVAAVVRGRTVEEEAARRRRVESELDLDVVNPDAPPPVPPPDPGAPVPPGTPRGPDKILHQPFTMEGAPHDLALTLTQPPVLEMQTVREPLISKIRRGMAEVRKNRSLPAAERDARVAALARIEIWALAVHDVAKRAGHAPPYLTPQVPGFKELAVLIHDYGNDYGVTDLATALESIVVDPKKPETVLHRFPALAADPYVRAQVLRIIASGVEATTLRKIVDNVRPIQADPVLDVLRLIDKMIASGSPNWQAVVVDLAIGGTMMKGALFVLRYIDRKFRWRNVLFEVREDPTDDTGRRWDAWVGGTLYQFKSWYRWTSVLEKTFLKQILEDYHRTRVGQSMPLRWVFETSLSREDIVRHMKDALAKVMLDLRQGREPRVPGYSGSIPLFIFTRVDAIVDRVEHP